MFCLETERVVSNDLVVRFENRFLQWQAKRNQRLGAGARVTVEQSRDGELRVRFEDRAVAFEEIDRPQLKGAFRAEAASGSAAVQTGSGPSLAVVAAVEKTQNGKIVGLWK